MLPDRVSNPGPLTYESGALPIALRGPAVYIQSLTTASGSKLFGSVVEHWTILTRRPEFESQQSYGIISLICYALFFVTAFMS